jgi:exopolysaccharide biosynthesis WecB/TagA/CpsF family protein
VGDQVPVGLLADRPIKQWDAVVKSAEDVVPRWMITVAVLPLASLRALAARLSAFVPVRRHAPARQTRYEFDSYDVDEFVDVAASFGNDRFGFVVTPNADHLIRLHDDTAFRSSYAVADYVLLDSRFLANILRVTKGIRLPVCTGSDLTESLFRDVISADDPLVLIGCSDEQALQLARRYGLRRLAHFNPPMGFIRDPGAVEACLRFIETHSPFRFCLLAVGAPQQEAVAQLLKSRGIARGLALCIGASINFLTGEERRAPLWMQRCGIEWSFRLLQAPGRMAGRYLVRGPRVFALLYRAAIVLRKKVPLLRLVHVPPHGGAAHSASPDSARRARRA